MSASPDDPPKTHWLRANQGHTPELRALSDYTRITTENRDEHWLGAGVRLMHCTTARCVLTIAHLGVMGKGYFKDDDPK
eukprot:4612578-Heterocapsa_arctica.AAC.1